MVKKNNPWEGTPAEKGYEDVQHGGAPPPSPSPSDTPSSSGGSSGSSSSGGSTSNPWKGTPAEEGYEDIQQGGAPPPSPPPPSKTRTSNTPMVETYSRQDMINQLKPGNAFLPTFIQGAQNQQQLYDLKKDIDPNATYEYTDPETGITHQISGTQAKEIINTEIQQQGQQGRESIVAASAGTQSALRFQRNTQHYPSGTNYHYNPQTGSITPDMKYVSTEKKLSYFKQHGTVTDQQTGKTMSWREYKQHNPAAYLETENGKIMVVQDYTRWNRERYEGSDPTIAAISKGTARFLGGYANPEYIIETVGHGKSGEQVIAKWEYEQQQRIRAKDWAGFSLNIPVVSNVFLPAATGAAVGIVARGAGYAMSKLAEQGSQQIANTLRRVGHVAMGIAGTEMVMQEGKNIFVDTPDDQKMNRLFTSGTRFASFGIGFKSALDYQPEIRIAEKNDKLIIQKFAGSIRGKPVFKLGKPQTFGKTPGGFSQVISPTSTKGLNFKTIKQFQAELNQGVTPRSGRGDLIFSGKTTTGIIAAQKPSAINTVPIVITKDVRPTSTFFEPVGETGASVIHPTEKPGPLSPEDIETIVHITEGKIQGEIPYKFKQVVEPPKKTSVENIIRNKRPLSPEDTETVFHKNIQKAEDQSFDFFKEKDVDIEIKNIVRPPKPHTETTIVRNTKQPVDTFDVPKQKEQFPNLKKETGPGGIEVLKPKTKKEILTETTPYRRTPGFFTEKTELDKLFGTKKGSRAKRGEYPFVFTERIKEIQNSFSSKMKGERGPGGSTVFKPKNKGKVLSPSESTVSTNQFPNLIKEVGPGGTTMFRPKKPGKTLTPSDSFEQYQREIKSKDIFSQKGPLSTRVLPKPIPYGKYYEPPFYGEPILETGPTVFDKKPIVKLRTTPKKHKKPITLKDLQQKGILQKDSDIKGMQKQGQKQVSILKQPKTETIKIKKQKPKEIIEQTEKEITKEETTTQDITSPDYKITSIGKIYSGKKQGVIPSQFTDLNVPPILRTSFDTQTKQKTENKTEQKTKQLLGLKSKQTQINKQSPLSITKVTQALDSTQKQRTDQTQIPASMQGMIPIQKLGMDLETEQELTTELQTPGLLDLPDRKSKQRQTFGGRQGYYVQYLPQQYKDGKRIRKKQWRKITSKPLSKADALALGSEKARKTPKASFRIIPADKPPQKLQRKIDPFILHQHQFYHKENDVYVEKPQNRINSEQELKGITYRGIQARRQGKGNKKIRQHQKKKKNKNVEKDIINLFKTTKKKRRRLF